MAGYQPLYIKSYETGLVQDRQQFILPADAYPILQNAYIFRERIQRKKAYQILGRLQRNLPSQSIGSTGGGGNLFRTLQTYYSLETSAQIVPGSVVVVVGGTITYTDNGLGVLVSSGIGTGTINYTTTALAVKGSSITTAATITFSYYPCLPVMGIRQSEPDPALNEQTVFFDTTYAYNFNSSINSFQEFLPGTTWTGSDSQFFWTTNYWVGDGNFNIFWATNFNDPIRYCNGQTATNWQNFSPQIDASGNLLLNCLAMLPFRGRLVVFNTIEGTINPGLSYTRRIRWAALGTPFTTSDGSIVTSNLNPNAWRDDIRGRGGFLDIPTSEDIVAIGFVRDNLVIYCERSTWQLRYTGRTIAPFQIERVNAELGAQSLFSAVQFDTSLLGIGDKGIVECDSYKSEKIDIKIPNFVFNLNNSNDAPQRIQGIRDFENRLVYWTVCSQAANGTYPDQRLVYNYENDSWSIFTDSLTALGTFQTPASRTWMNTNLPWINCNFPWIDQPAFQYTIVGGNQQGFIEYLNETTTNDPSLYISAITANSPNSTTVTSPNHNLQTGAVISISGIPTGTAFANLNGGIFSIVLSTSDPTNTFSLNLYNPLDGEFSIPQLDTTPANPYVGGGLISVRDNFDIVSKKFGFIEDGQSIQMGYFDILMNATEQASGGAISVNVYLDYDDNTTSNTLPANVISGGLLEGQPDQFFNATIPTTSGTTNMIAGSKFWQRVFCPTRANFLTLEYTFSNAQMAGIEQTLDVQIDAQILWLRRAGRLTQAFS
jgi:hypothetical protein